MAIGHGALRRADRGALQFVEGCRGRRRISGDLDFLRRRPSLLRGNWNIHHHSSRTTTTAMLMLQSESQGGCHHRGGGGWDKECMRERSLKKKTEE